MGPIGAIDIRGGIIAAPLFVLALRVYNLNLRRLVDNDLGGAFVLGARDADVAVEAEGFGQRGELRRVGG
jgi:hypothetical protein